MGDDPNVPLSVKDNALKVEVVPLLVSLLTVGDVLAEHVHQVPHLKLAVLLPLPPVLPHVLKHCLAVGLKSQLHAGGSTTQSALLAERLTGRQVEVVPDG